MITNGIVQKIWNFCHTLRDDGIGYGDYLEHITYLLFLKMTHVYSQPLYHRDTNTPEEYNWESLVEE